jgi:hypothetical protein
MNTSEQQAALAAKELANFLSRGLSRFAIWAYSARSRNGYGSN